MAHLTTRQETIEEIRLLQYAKSQLETVQDINDITISVPNLNIKHIYHNKLAKAICYSVARTIERYSLSLNNNKFFHQ